MAETRRAKKDEEELEPAKAAAEAVKETDPPEESDKFPVDRLAGDMASLVGYAPHEIAGALDGVSRKTLTIEEAKAATAKWLKSPVKED
jgi:hypothetical protein